MRTRPRPRLRTILLVLNLIILILPLGGIAFLHLYENELIKQTESELISQTALIAAFYKEEFAVQLEIAKRNDPRILRRYAIVSAAEQTANDPFTPIPPSLDLTSAVIHPPSEDYSKRGEPDPLASQAGEAVVPAILEAKKINLSGIRIVDSRGVIVASSGADLGLSMAGLPETATALKGKPVSLLRMRQSRTSVWPLESINRGSRIRVHVALPILIENRAVGAVVASRTPVDISQALYNIRYQLLKGGLFLLGIVFMMTLFASHFIGRPVNALMRQIKAIESGNRDGRESLKTPAVREFAQLSESLGKMADTLEQRSEYIRTFAANVSHEFKTPLTSIHGSVELLKDHFAEMNPAEREKFLRMIDDQTQHLEKMVRRLLELARAEVYRPGGESAEIGPVLAGLADRYRERSLDVRVEVEDVVRHADISPEVLLSILTNLLDNAFFHNRGKCSVAVRVSAAGSDWPDTIEILVSDDGRGISQENTERIFRPFFTTARDQGGSGLGLTIVRALLEAHGGSIELLTAAKGASFLVRIRSKY
jgi:signal transduction histidine kinase